MKLNDFKNYLNKIFVFYFPGKAGYWNSITPSCITEKPRHLGRYYLDFSSKADYPDNFSAAGIPQYSFRGQPYIEHPIPIAQYALGLYELLNRKENSDEMLQNKFLRIAAWFVDNKIDLKEGISWYIYNEYPEYGLTYPWISAMAQGEAISVLSRAAMLSQDNNFEELAIKALVPFECEVKDGGFINYFNSIPVYEEFTTPVKTMAVLNGFIFALFGIYDLILLNNNEKAQNIFNKGVDSLKKILPYFDIKYWTRYYLFDYPQKYYSSFTYHILVAEQLKAMFFLTGENQFKTYSEKWFGYAESFIKKTRALLGKLVFANKVTT
jgi:heparosan-N-sulfate-glucuronate 5-epimerase